MSLSRFHYCTCQINKQRKISFIHKQKMNYYKKKKSYKNCFLLFLHFFSQGVNISLRFLFLCCLFCFLFCFVCVFLYARTRVCVCVCVHAGVSSYTHALTPTLNPTKNEVRTKRKQKKIIR